MEEERLYDLYALDEDIKILEEFIKEIETENPLDSYFDEEAKAIEHLIEAYRKLEEKNRKLDEKFKYAVPDNIVEENYIPKSKIKEKIEVLKKCLSDTNVIMISILEELLEEE